MKASNNNRQVGTFHLTLTRNNKVIDQWDEKNTATDQGLAYMNNIAFNRSSPTAKTNWYIGIFVGAGLDTYALRGTKATGIVAATTETSAYDEATRPVWDINNALGNNDATDRTITNDPTAGSQTGSAATFTINSTISITGGFLITANNKGVEGGATDIVFALSNFLATRNAEPGDVLNIIYDSELTSAS